MSNFELPTSNFQGPSFDVRSPTFEVRHVLYARLTDEFEIPDLIQSRRSLRVEWYIVILIVFEIVLTLYEMFIRGK